jgi:hypothetical protein
LKNKKITGYESRLSRVIQPLLEAALKLEQEMREIAEVMSLQWLNIPQEVGCPSDYNSFSVIRKDVLDRVGS